MYTVKMSLIVGYDIKLYCRLNQAIIMVVEMHHFQLLINTNMPIMSC